MKKKNPFNEKLERVRQRFLAGIGVPEPTEVKADPFQLRALESILSGC